MTRSDAGQALGMGRLQEEPLRASASRRMQSDEFLAWASTRPKGERYELDGGEVVATATERAAHIEAKFEVAASLKAAIGLAGLRYQAFIDGLTARTATTPSTSLARSCAAARQSTRTW